MYGMIHQALQDMATEHMTETEWTTLLRNAGHTQPLFIGMEYYSDDITMALIHLLADHLGLSMDEALQEFGRVWIDFAGASAYGRILRMAGDDLLSFLESLDRMHASIRSNMPLAEMPSFELIDADAQQMVLRYRSTRTGLAPLVQGILLATSARFGETVAVTYEPETRGALFTIRRVPTDE